MTSISKTYWEVLLAQAICMGIGLGCLFVPSVAIVSTYFSTKKAFAMGIAASGSSLGKISPCYEISISNITIAIVTLTLTLTSPKSNNY
jgi:MFS family permease